MIVSDIMTSDLLTARVDLTIGEAVLRATERDVHHLLVVERGRLRGVACICELREHRPEQRLGELLTRPPVVIWPQCTLKQAARRFVEKQVSFFPVCDGAELVGVITRGDLRRSVISEAMLPSSFRCTFCGSTRHVRALPGDGSLAACLDCTDRSAPAAHGFYEEGDKD